MIYNLLLTILFPFFCFSKKLRYRLFFSLPEMPQGEWIWIHAVSFGEMNIVASFLPHLKVIFPKAHFALSTVTDTGFNLGKTLPVDLHFILPLDFKWKMKTLARRIKPALMLFIEGDFWPNHLAALSCPKVLLNGKLSMRSFKRWSLIKGLARRLLFHHFDLIVAQDDIYRDRFKALGAAKVIVSPNMKFHLPLFSKNTLFSNRSLRSIHGTESTEQAVEDAPCALLLPFPGITLASTHEGEEERLLSTLKHLPYTFFLAPRHPARLRAVEALLYKLSLSYIPLSQKENYRGERVILVDVMGQLPFCFSQSVLAIVGGSFVPVGGHNILEPLAQGIPVFFGPHMEAQAEMVKAVLAAGVGFQVPLDALPLALASACELGEKCLKFKEKLQEKSQETLLSLIEVLDTLPTQLTRDGAVVSSLGS